MTYPTLAIGDERRARGFRSALRRDPRLARDEAFHHELGGFYERSIDGYMKWREHDLDTIRFSEAFPEVLFVL